MKIVFVGLSNKINKMPFDITTNSGKIVHEIISRLKDECYLMNLVDYAPLDENLRLRYPTEQEIIDCTQKFKKKIKKINPDLIVSFGNITTNHLKKLNLKTKLLSFYHPSYIFTYKHQQVDTYIEEIVHTIQKEEKTWIP